MFLCALPSTLQMRPKVGVSRERRVAKDLLESSHLPFQVKLTRALEGSIPMKKRACTCTVESSRRWFALTRRKRNVVDKKLAIGKVQPLILGQSACTVAQDPTLVRSKDSGRVRRVTQQSDLVEIVPQPRQPDPLTHRVDHGYKPARAPFDSARTVRSSVFRPLPNHSSIPWRSLACSSSSYAASAALVTLPEPLTSSTRSQVSPQLCVI